MSFFVLNERAVPVFGAGGVAAPRKGRLAARAALRGTEPGSRIAGEVRFYESRGDDCIVEAEVRGLPSGPDAQQFLGFHIHERGSCADAGNAAGEHYNPQNQPHGFHAGDLPALLNAGGVAECGVYTNRFSPVQVFNRSVVVHAMPDDYQTQPSGASGARIACGVIRPV